MTFEELYRRVLKDRLAGRETTGKGIRKKLDCLLHPEKHPLVWRNEW